MRWLAGQAAISLRSARDQSPAASFKRIAVFPAYIL